MTYSTAQLYGAIAALGSIAAATEAERRRHGQHGQLDIVIHAEQAMALAETLPKGSPQPPGRSEKVDPTLSRQQRRRWERIHGRPYDDRSQS